MDEYAQTPTYRRIGAIFVDRGLITEGQLASALAEQQESGRPLGEICVERFGLDRLYLADALASQWDEMRAVTTDDQPRSISGVDQVASAVALAPEEDELRVLLEEAQAARVELECKTEELGQRLAALEALVADVSVALSEIRPTEKPGRVSRQRSRRAAPVPTPVGTEATARSTVSKR